MGWLQNLLIQLLSDTLKVASSFPLPALLSLTYWLGPSASFLQGWEVAATTPYHIQIQNFFRKKGDLFPPCVFWKQGNLSQRASPHSSLAILSPVTDMGKGDQSKPIPWNNWLGQPPLKQIAAGERADRYLNTIREMIEWRSKWTVDSGEADISVCYSRLCLLRQKY